MASNRNQPGDFSEGGLLEKSCRYFRSAWVPTAALLGILWLLIFNQQRLEWTVNVVYSYGWAVPVLALFLLRER